MLAKTISTLRWAASWAFYWLGAFFCTVADATPDAWVCGEGALSRYSRRWAFFWYNAYSKSHAQGDGKGAWTIAD